VGRLFHATLPRPSAATMPPPWRRCAGAGVNLQFTAKTTDLRQASFISPPATPHYSAVQGNQRGGLARSPERQDFAALNGIIYRMAAVPWDDDGKRANAEDAELHPTSKLRRRETNRASRSRSREGGTEKAEENPGGPICAGRSVRAYVAGIRTQPCTANHRKRDHKQCNADSRRQSTAILARRTHRRTGFVPDLRPWLRIAVSLPWPSHTTAWERVA